MALFRTANAFLADGTLVGTANVHVLYSHGYPAVFLRNTAFCCPICGEVWGRWVFDVAPLSGWLFAPRPCTQHGGGFFLPALGDLPQIVERDFLIYELLTFAQRKEYDYLDRKSAADELLVTDPWA